MFTQLTFLSAPIATLKLRALRETPTTRIRASGAAAASVLELLGAILGNADTALAVLAQFPTLDALAKASPLELEQVRGVGPSGAARVKAALELARRLLQATPEERLQIRSPADAAAILMPEMSLLEQEHLKAMLLDTRNRVITTVTVYVGSLNSSIVRTGELFREAIRLNAASIIVAHNHPSGDPAPSPEDVSVTRGIISAGQLLDIEVLDHLVIGQQRFVSLKERGLAFSA
jgi:DNA repair protein RadC